MTEEKLSLPERRFADRVRQAREEKGWSQAELAEALVRGGISHANASMVSRIEAAKRPVRLTEGEALATVFETSLKAMMSDSFAARQIELRDRQHREARVAYVMFKEATLRVVRLQAEMQRALSSLIHFEDEGIFDDLDEELKARYRTLLRNITSFAEIDLATEVKDFEEQVRAHDESLKSTGVGRFIQAHDRDGWRVAGERGSDATTKE